MKFDQTINSILNTSFFVESPMYYDGVFNLQMQDVHYNEEVTRKITESNEPFDTFLDWKVYKVQDSFDSDIFTFCLVKDSLIDAFIEIASRKDSNFSRGVWQRKTNKGLIRNFVLNFLPNYYKSLISDKTANKMGVKFYKKLLEDALKKGFIVKVLKGSLTNEFEYNPEEFDSYWVHTEKDVPTHPTFVTSKDILFKIDFKKDE